MSVRIHPAGRRLSYVTTGNSNVQPAEWTRESCAIREIERTPSSQRLGGEPSALNYANGRSLKMP